jgi:hypothetical protein
VVAQSARAHPLGEPRLRLGEILEQERDAGQRAPRARVGQTGGGGAGGVELLVDEDVELRRALQAVDRRSDELERRDVAASNELRLPGHVDAHQFSGHQSAASERSEMPRVWQGITV